MGGMVRPPMIHGPTSRQHEKWIGGKMNMTTTGQNGAKPYEVNRTKRDL